MKNLAFTILLFCITGLQAQTAKEYAVLVTADVGSAPAFITLNWNAETATSYQVFRKDKTQPNFPAVPLATLPGTATQFTDSTAKIGTSYEYDVKKVASGFTGHGYINAGIEVPAMHSKGKLILLVDSAQVVPLESEITRLEYDLEMDGWSVQRLEVSPSAKVFDIRNDIIDVYNASNGMLKAVFILGHVPVPYSGNLAPDGHTDHVGAWPSDVYYGELTSGWGDNVVNVTTASDPRNRNVPGDGKFDNTFIPSSVELQVGRVDFANMPAFSKSETELLRAYLNKDHAYRVGEVTAVPRAVIDDNFGGFSGEAFAASAWKSFAPMFGADSIVSGDYFTTLKNQSYLWSYGCGGGTYTSAGGVGTTANFAADSLQSVFTMLFGSYFGDWDHSDNFLRAPLAQGMTLTNAWSGRPHWHFHHMALGENIGYSFLLAANNLPYASNYAAGYVHIALMGDPTLRMNIIRPPSELIVEAVAAKANLTWSPSPDVVDGYHIYRRKINEEEYELLNQKPVTDSSFTDFAITESAGYAYKVCAVRLEQTKSGSYFNLSPGVRDTVSVKGVGIAEQNSDVALDVFPNPGDGFFHLKIRSDHSENMNLKVVNVSGKVVAERKLVLNQNEQVLPLDLTSLQNGFYLLQISGSQGRLVKSVVISRH